jgi:hypothetical protein
VPGSKPLVVASHSSSATTNSAAIDLLPGPIAPALYYPYCNYSFDKGEKLKSFLFDPELVAIVVIV